MRRAVVAAVVVAAVFGVVSVRACSGTGSAEEREPAGAPFGSPSPTVADAPPVVSIETNEFGVTIGWPRDRDGALTAAASAIRTTGAIAKAGFITRSDMIGSLASERYGPTLAAESSTQLAEMAAEIGAASVAPSELVWSEIPLTARVVTADEHHARVEVWSVLVVGVPDVGAPRQAWRTVTIDLTWEHDDWKIDGWSARPGPTPLLDATAAVASTDEIERVISWPPSPGGGA